MSLAPRQHGVLDGAFAQVVQDLVARDPARAGDRKRFVQILDVEVADAPRADLPVGLEGLEGRDGLGQRRAPAPVEEVAVEPVGPQTRQRALARLDRATARCVLG